MLSFHHPLVLIGLAGVALPVLIHLFARQRVKRVAFSSIAFLKRIHAQRLRRMQLRQILLLILRSLAVLFAVLAFARPALRTQGLLGGSGSTSAVLIVDGSLSMGGPGLRDQAVNQSEAVLNLMDSEDETTLLDINPRHDSEMGFNSPNRVGDQLRTFRVASYFGDASTALKNAADLLSGLSSINREIYLISDFQATGFVAMADSAVYDGLSVFLMPLARETENVGITACGIENRMLQPGLPLDVFTEVENFGIRHVENLLVRLSVQDRDVAQCEVTLEPGTRERVRFKITPKPGWIWGSARIEDDALDGDNARHFSAWLPERVRVLVVGGAREDGALFLNALAPWQSRGLIQTTVAVSGEEWANQLGDHDVVVMNNFPGLRRDAAARLTRFVEAGGGLLFWPGPSVDLSLTNRTLLDAFGLTLGNVIGSGPAGGFFEIGSLESEHPLFSGVFEEGRERVRSPRIYRLVEITGSPDPIISMTDGKPLFVEGVTGGGRLLLAATGIHSQWSDLAVSTIFAPLVARSVMYLASSELASTERMVGDPLHGEVRTDQSNSNSWVLTPMDEEIRLLPTPVSGGLRLTLEEAAAPGVYRFYADDRLVSVAAVNVDPRESNLTPMPIENLEEGLPGADVRVIKAGDDTESVVSRARWGLELWREMLILAVLALIAEMLLARTPRNPMPKVSHD